MLKHIEIYLVFMISLLIFSDLANAAATATCNLCLTNEVKNSKNICDDCLFGYVANKIESGYVFIIKFEYARGRIIYDYDDLEENNKTIRKYYYYDDKDIIKIIGSDESLHSKYARNKIDLLDRKKGLKPCVSPNCDGKLLKPEAGKSSCEKCGEIYVREYLGKDVRYCQYCDAPITLVDGCEKMFCTTCAHTIDWELAKKGVPPSSSHKKSSNSSSNKKGICVLF